MLGRLFRSAPVLPADPLCGRRGILAREKAVEASDSRAERHAERLMRMMDDVIRDGLRPPERDEDRV